MMRLLFLMLIPALLLPGCKGRDQRLKEEGEALAARIDSFQRATQRLPDNLAALGIQETEEGPLYYQKRDSAHYTIHFGTSLGHSMVYDPQQKGWKEN